MVQIERFNVLENYRIHFRFKDGVDKIVDFEPYIKDDPITQPLRNPDYFKQVRLYERGSGIYWPNGYDFDPTYLRNYGNGEVMYSVTD